MAYTTEEQELLFHFDQLEKKWTVETNIHNQIRKLEPMLIPETVHKEMEDGRVISIRGELDTEKYNIVAKKRPPKREFTEEQKEELRVRMAKMHAARDKKLKGEEDVEG